MTSLSSQKTRLITNFIIIPAPQMPAIEECQPPQEVKREESPLLQEEKSNERELPDQEGSLVASKRKRYPKDDYQKNITINVVKCCIRELLCQKYRRLLEKRCEKEGIRFEELRRMVNPILKEVVISLGDLKKMLTSGCEEQIKLKRVFSWFLQWYLRKRYMYYLLNEGKMNHKERYIEYKNKYMLYLLMLIKEEEEQQFALRQIRKSNEKIVKLQEEK